MPADKETLTPAAEPDRFEHESPLRAFTDWNAHGSYAIGKGLRPSVAHLPVYLDAIERKEGWQLVQMLLDGNGSFRSAIFRRSGWWKGKVNGHLAFATRKLGECFEPLQPSEEELAFYEDMGRKHTRAVEMAAELDAEDGGYEMIDPIESAFGDFPNVAPFDPKRYGKKLYDEWLRGEIEKGFLPDDPVNPPHYGGTACAEIGERLTPNAYQTLKYCWRLGEKDDPVVELGKAIWYWKREIELYKDRPRLPRLFCPDFDLAGRIADRIEFTRQIVLSLWSGFTFGMLPDHRQAILVMLERELERRKNHEEPSDDLYEEEPSYDNRGRGMEP